MTNLFFEFLRFSIRQDGKWTRELSAKEWRALLEMAKRQTLVGVMFAGVQKVDEACRPPKDVLLEWFALAGRIKTYNHKLDKGCATISEHFEKSGFYTCILKGQGNAQLYLYPDLRMPGDIDIWVWPKDEEFGNSTLSHRRKKTVRFVTSEIGKQPCFYHHIDYPKFAPIEVEVHFTPTWLHCPSHNRALQRFIEAEAHHSFGNLKMIGGGACAVPTWKLNVIFQLIHLQNHLIDEGIGLRQMMDYYYLLITTDNGQRTTDNGRSLPIDCRQLTIDNKLQTTDNGQGGDVQEMIELLGLRHFASATMWVLHKVFGLEERYFITEANQNLGEFLLHEIMMSGNFGQYDERINRESQQKMWSRVGLRFMRSLKFYKICRSEINWTIPFKTWHYFWRRLR